MSARQTTPRYGKPRGTAASTRRLRAGRTRATAKSVVGAVVMRNPMAVIAVITLIMFGFTWAYWQSGGLSFAIAGGLGNKSAVMGMKRDAATDEYVNRRFVMGGVKLGMTRAMVEQRHPDAQYARDRAGREVLTIPTPNGMMVAWLYRHEEVVRVNGEAVLDPVDRVYRLRLDEAFPHLSEPEILGRYAQEYGRPLDSDCTAPGYGETPRCTYHWWGGDGIKLNATIKKKTDINGRAYTLLTTVATDTVQKKQVTTASLSLVRGRLRWGVVN